MYLQIASFACWQNRFRKGSQKQFPHLCNSFMEFFGRDSNPRIKGDNDECRRTSEAHSPTDLHACQDCMSCVSQSAVSFESAISIHLESDIKTTDCNERREPASNPGLGSRARPLLLAYLINRPLAFPLVNSYLIDFIYLLKKSTLSELRPASPASNSIPLYSI